MYICMCVCMYDNTHYMCDMFIRYKNSPYITECKNIQEYSNTKQSNPTHPQPKLRHQCDIKAVVIQGDKVRFVIMVSH